MKHLVRGNNGIPIVFDSLQHVHINCNKLSKVIGQYSHRFLLPVFFSFL